MSSLLSDRWRTLMRKAMNHNNLVCLVQTAHGRVNACAYMSLTFGWVTLYFENECEFLEMADRVLDEENARKADEEFDLRYD